MVCQGKQHKWIGEANEQGAWQVSPSLVELVTAPSQVVGAEKGSVGDQLQTKELRPRDHPEWESTDASSEL